MSSHASLADLMAEIGRKARHSARIIALASAETKNTALQYMADEIRKQAETILDANRSDLNSATDLPAAFQDRLKLDKDRLEAIASALESIMELPDPVGRVLAHFERPNGLIIDRVSTPLGVVGVIFEARPNVTADAGGLCLKSGNAAILRAGSSSFRSATALCHAMRQGLERAGLPADIIQLVPVKDREAVGEMLKGLNGSIDVIVPRGGKNLVARVQEEARVPVFAHLEGICHTYIHKNANLDMALKIVKNAKLRRTGICGSTETLLVDRDCIPTHLKPLLLTLLEAGCEIRGDETVQKVDTRIKPATEADWRTEYLDSIISVKIVSDCDEAIRHIEHYGSHHTDAIITDDQEIADHFMKEVDSAIVMHNASTQFADGGEFGFGAEIGIATGRMHARGPVGVEQLTSFKYCVHGQGQIRP